MVSAPAAATQEAANFASHRRRDVAAAPRRPPSLPFLPLPPPLQNIISGSHLELSISNPRAAAATLGVGGGGGLFPVDAFSSSSNSGRGAAAPPPQENYLRSIEPSAPCCRRRCRQRCLKSGGGGERKEGTVKDVKAAHFPSMR